MGEDLFHLERFVEAQNPVIETVRAELQAGEKRSHWMWYVFPQIDGLGSSAMARMYAITSREEAEAYLRHPVLRARLLECADLVCCIEGRSIERVFGPVDAIKFRSSMSLFTMADPSIRAFSDALQKYYGGKLDSATVDRLA